MSVLLGMPCTNAGHPPRRKVSPTQGVAYPGVLLIPMTKMLMQDQILDYGIQVCGYSSAPAVRYMFHSRMMRALGSTKPLCTLYFLGGKCYLCDKGLADKLAKFEFLVQITTSYKSLTGADLQSHARLNIQCTLLLVH